MRKGKATKYPIPHWSYSSLLSYLRNPLAWYKRYVERVYDMPSGPSAFIGKAGHTALQHYYGGMSPDASVALGLESLRAVDDSEIEFGASGRTKKARREKRQHMEGEYLQAIGFYLAKAPKYKRIYGIEHSATTQVPGLPLPIKAISDLVVASPKRGHVDIVDHKFVESFSPLGADKPLFVLQAIFNYYTVQSSFNKPVARFILQECRKRKNKDGSSQMRRYILDYKDYESDFEVFHRLVKEASAEIATRKSYLPNPSDMFEGKNSFDIYRLGL